MLVLATAGAWPEANFPFAGRRRLRRAAPQIAPASRTRRRNAGRAWYARPLPGAFSAATARSATATSLVHQAGSSRSRRPWPRDGRVRIPPA